jgi:hypothetical protein
MLARRAIPDVRWRYFTDPELNAGGRKSRQEVFIDNGCDLRAILTHPHFLKYLRYFIAGPQLPADVRSRFEELATESLGDQEALRAYVRASVREDRVSRDDAAEEFFKLAIECGIELRAAGQVRTDAMNAARRQRR